MDGSTSPNIWQLQASEDIPGLIDALDDPDPGVRKRAAAALRILDAAQALPTLEKALETEDDWQAQASMTAAVQYLSREGRQQDQISAFKADRLADLIAQQNTASLLEVLAGGNEAESIIVVRALGQIGDQDAVEPLVNLFQAETTSDDVRYVVAETLLELKGAPTVVSLVAGLRREEWQIRRNSAAILGQLKATWAAPALADALRDDHPLVRRTAEAALRQLNTPAAQEALVEWQTLQIATRRAATQQVGVTGSRPEQAAAQQPADNDGDTSWVETIEPPEAPPCTSEPAPTAQQAALQQAAAKLVAALKTEVDDNDGDTSWVEMVEAPEAPPTSEPVPAVQQVEDDDEGDTSWVEMVEPSEMPSATQVAATGNHPEQSALHQAAAKLVAALQAEDDDDDTSQVETVEQPEPPATSEPVPAAQQVADDNGDSDDATFSPDPAEVAPPTDHNTPTVVSQPTKLQRPPELPEAPPDRTGDTAQPSEETTE